MLTDEGYRVILAKDGFEALKILRQIGPPDRTRHSRFFPSGHGWRRCLRRAAGANPNVNVVLSSGFAEQSKLGTMLAQGLRGFIPKPYTREKLLEQVRSDARRAGRQLMR